MVVRDRDLDHCSQRPSVLRTLRRHAVRAGTEIARAGSCRPAPARRDDDWEHLHGSCPWRRAQLTSKAVRPPGPLPGAGLLSPVTRRPRPAGTRPVQTPLLHFRAAGGALGGSRPWQRLCKRMPMAVPDHSTRISEERIPQHLLDRAGREIAAAVKHFGQSLNASFTEVRARPGAGGWPARVKLRSLKSSGPN
jgi:hypothetical protein